MSNKRTKNKNRNIGTVTIRDCFSGKPVRLFQGKYRKNEVIVAESGAGRAFRDLSVSAKTVEAMKMAKSLGLSDKVMIVDLDKKRISKTQNIRNF